MAETRSSAPAEAPVTLRMTRRFKAPPGAVFRAWTDPKALAQWMGPPGVSTRDVRIDLRVGGGYSLVMDGSEGGVYPLSGTYREIAPPSRLVFTFVWGHGVLDGVEMLVSLDFAEDKGGTLLTLVQERIPTETARERHTEGWQGSFDRLETYLAAGKPASVTGKRKPA